MSDGKASIISALKELDCCTRCILFSIGVDPSEETIQTYLKPEKKLEVIESDNDQPKTKRIRKNICPGCLNILEDSLIEQLVSNICLDEVEYYKCIEFCTLVSLPKCSVLRVQSIYLHLKDTFPELAENLKANREGTLKRIFRIASSEFISQRINKIYKSQANLSIEFEILYEDDESELESIRHTTKTKNLSRLNIENFLKNSTEEEFRAVYPVPPTSPNKLPTCRIKYRSVPLYLGGRYLKFSREMGQTPFIVNNKRITETSVEEILFESIRKVLKFKGTMVFSGSGREDSDTRMLGDGRPFYIQLENPAHYNITFRQCREIEEEILKSNVCAVIKLGDISSNSLRRIKEGEEFKKKHYKALCYTEHPNVKDAIEVINNYKGELKLSQQTPVRVSHRRTISMRPKMIYSMNATLVPGFPQLFELNVITQAGTYVKEFVNSDFNRTSPSITSIIKFPADVVALDVTKVELDWP